MNIIKKIHYNSPLILTYTFISLIALILGVATSGYTTKLLFSVYRCSITDPFAYVRIFAHVFGHASIEHFFGNFMIILLIGPILEEKYGSKNMFFMIFTTAIITGLINIFLFPTGLLGASGVAFMLIVLSSFVNLQKGRIPLTFIFIVIIFVGREVITGLNTRDNISQVTHIAGGICGGLFGMHFRKKEESLEEPIMEELIKTEGYFEDDIDE